MSSRICIPEKLVNLNKKDVFEAFLILIFRFSSSLADNILYDISLLLQWEVVIRSYFSDIKPISSTNIRAVNREVTALSYISDHYNYGKKDYRATPEEFYAEGCNHTIEKYFRLHQAGIANENMTLVVGRKNNSAKAIAVLLVRYNDTRFYLDNESDYLSPEPAYLQQFTPLYFEDNIFFGRRGAVAAHKPNSDHLVGI